MRVFRSLGTLLVASTLALGGCAKRLPLGASELERVKTASGVAPLRVYVSKKVLSIYAEANISEDYKVQKTIRSSSDQDGLKEVTLRDTSGLILKIDEVNGATALWVTFDPHYDKPEDAMLFVQGDDGLFRLSVVPERKSYKLRNSYRGCKCKGRILRPGKMRSLAEQNDVLLVKKPNGKLLTIELQVKKIVDDRTRTRTRRAQGID
ncbi:MAG: hypothetical protein IAG13_38995 [Deltaproteobacteria bacterium]|nr:hypothetical protein [Nannocystaceae bacterium]